MILALMLVGCDPGWRLTLRDQTGDDFVSFGDVRSKITLSTLHNAEFYVHFELIYPDSPDSLLINRDSLKIFHNDVLIPHALFHPNTFPPFDPQHEIIFTFNLDYRVVKKSDIICIEAEKFIGVSGIYFDLKRICFTVPREFGGTRYLGF